MIVSLSHRQASTLRTAAKVSLLTVSMVLAVMYSLTMLMVAVIELGIKAAQSAHAELEAIPAHVDTVDTVDTIDTVDTVEADYYEGLSEDAKAEFQAILEDSAALLESFIPAMPAAIMNDESTEAVEADGFTEAEGVEESDITEVPTEVLELLLTEAGQSALDKRGRKLNRKALESRVKNLA